ncbi:galactokinase [Flagellimonas flava]|uniref:Galactokinase n=1 Tax=Flagellimonas flava TaxID=570519 RepID=A0A1M5INM9_9FLAO|nr:galactokinase [Allomuricauda flava]SHG29887.1 galactokinase [Allomuricauda flava]
MNIKPEITIASPGRINLIGEHIDYNGGHVLPAAIDLCVRLYFKKNNSPECTIYSKNVGDRFKIDLKNIEISEKEWHNYFLGVIHFIEQKYPNTISSFDCVVDSALPIGSGVSSSAALECGFAKGLDELFDIGLSEMDIITMARDAEHHFVGTKCGIMDQFAVVRGKKDELIRLDCNDLSFNYVPAQIAPYALVLVNSNVSHNLATSEYNVRRQECESGMQHIQKRYPQYNCLAEVPQKVVKEIESTVPSKTFQRLLYVIQENIRTKEACSALVDGDMITVGQKLFESHAGLSELYEVSCTELDFLVDFAKGFPGIIGARMMGGGFGGCTINLVHQSKVNEFMEKVTKAYQEQFGIQPTPFTVSIGDGVRRIS